MRLLKRSDTGGFSLTKDLVGDDTIPSYAILSHTWDEGQEITFQELRDGIGKDRTGYNKIRFCGEQAERHGLQHFWVDTCCIDKSSYVELQDAINSMFSWYHNAAKCYVYLSDVSETEQKASNGMTELTWESAFRKSRWFTRGWTLQELLAPRSVEFFSREGKKLGDKRTLERQIHEITRIAVQGLRNQPLHEFEVTERLSWATSRQTKRPEDKAYSLLGIFGICMPSNYGEGENNAFRRLQEELSKVSNDEWVLAPAAMVAERKLADERMGYSLGEISWMNIMRRRKRDKCCFNCGNGSHWEGNCQERCGKCLYRKHTSSWCEHEVRCKKCYQQGHVSEDCQIGSNTY
ncbi:HET-domain-containing protein [Bimuria novae-zelandiae CBS 107.79]|uniref:HET-domain-containing protein n=1 Tax=Bimuria novae-zelandiae CBS 107.79 TaxID=1447943 RepID=A0A6A5VBN7_9PLEO|nr:HET-domain-containing protein [Bimuria novae-zelandiae CBS 107.79]